MESLLIWTVVLVLVAAGVALYTRNFRIQRQSDRNRLTQTRDLGMDKATGQYPLVDAGACIGCATCVAACPEGDVLGIVMGKAVVINGSRCIGHGKCAEACPVGAMKVGLGDITKRDDIPLLNEHNETNVPGLWIAGELSGFALINNAVEQGRKVVEQIAEQIAETRELQKSNPSPDLLDIVIVGAGPAGMSAGLVAGEQGLSCVVLDQQGTGGTILQYPRRKLVMVQPVEIPRMGKLPRHEYRKEELLEIWEELYSNYDLDIRTEERVTAVTGQKGNFDVVTDSGTYRAKNVVLALGRRGTPRKLLVPGEDSPKVAYQLIDAEAYSGRRVLIVGGGDSAVEAAMGLAHQKGCEVTISYRKPDLMRIKQRNADRIAPMIAEGKIDFRGGTNVSHIQLDSVVLESGTNTTTIPNDDVFILAGGIPPFGFLRELGVKFGGDQMDIVAPE